MLVLEVKKQLRVLAAEVGRGGLGAVGSTGGGSHPLAVMAGGVGAGGVGAAAGSGSSELGGKDPPMVELSP